MTDRHLTTGGLLVEGDPTHCPAGHNAGPPVNGVVLATRRREPCQCPGSRHSVHRAWHCEHPTCPDPWWREGRCTDLAHATPARLWDPQGLWGAGVHGSMDPPGTEPVPNVTYRRPV